MKDEEVKQTLDLPVEEVTTEIDTSNAQDTQASLEGNAQHDEVTETVNDSTDDQSGQQPEEKVKDQNDPRQAGKMSWLEKQRNAAEEKAQKLATASHNAYLKLLSDPNKNAETNREFANDPDLYESFRQAHERLTGEKLNSYAQVYNQQPVSQGQPRSQDSYSSRAPISEEEITQKVTQRIRNEDIVSKFRAAVPEMDPINAKDDYDKYKQARNWQAVLVNAEILMDENPKFKGDLNSALVEAWNTLPINIGKQVKQAAQIGEMTGRAIENAKNIGVGNQVAAGDRGKEPTNSYSSEDLALFKKLGIRTDEQKKAYLVHKNG